MSETHKKWQGQVVDAKFVLGEYLGGSDNTAVFVTQHGDKNPQKAAIKLMPADAASAERQLALWRRSAQLSHPNLVSILQFGRCAFQDNDILYVVMEYQEEDLSQILPQRPLAPAEARVMLEPVLEALAYLHSDSLAHGRIKPANILAKGDQIKLSSDTIAPLGESRRTIQEKTAYDSPESATVPLSPAGDVWSLGVTLVEALTLRVPAVHNAEHILPDSLPSPFLEIARHCLRIDPARRWSIAEIAACLNPNSAEAAPPASATSSSAAAPAVSRKDSSSVPSTVASSSDAATQAPVATAGLANAVPSASPAAPPRAAAPASPLAVPLSPVPPLPREQMSRVPDARTQTIRGGQKARSNSRYPILAAAVAVVLIAIFAVPRLLNHREPAYPSTTAVAREERAKPIAETTAEKPAQPLAPPSAAPSSRSQLKSSAPTAANSLKTASEKETIVKEEPSNSSAPSGAPPTSASTQSVASRSARGEVLDQVLPEVSEKARATIHGKVRVVVRVHVDPSGNVSSADFDSPGPSKFFADLAMQAARRWEFQSPETEGHSLPSEWLLRFEFTPTDTQVFPTQQTP